MKVLNERNKITLFLDIMSVWGGMILSLFFRYDLDWNTNNRAKYTISYVIVFLIIYYLLKMNRKSWSYTNIIDISKLIVVNLVCFLIFLFLKILNIVDVNVLVLGLGMFFSIFIQFIFRYLFKLNKYWVLRKYLGEDKKKVLIYGAGNAGTLIARESIINRKFPYEIIGFIDDDKKKRGTHIYDIEVLETGKKLEEVMKNTEIQEMIIAIPSLNKKELKKIVNKIKDINEKIKIKILPSVSEMMNSSTSDLELKEVKIEDLLGREEVLVNTENIRELIEGKVLFITGGAGSIGSELARQVAKYNPAKLICIDVNENDLYFLELELKRKYQNLEFVSEICNIREKEKLSMLFKQYNPQIVFHAAAHKHVPLMEHNPEEAVKNNIFGTKNIAECANKYEVEKMILISTDKAVNPTNIMGATKRVCEIIIEDFNKKSEKTKYMAVRFGNVLGSNGSVIPIFKKLIEENKNLTVTHKEITRYFMTIPEAVQLVMEAGSIGKGGEIFILDMGEPVKIYELAENMIKLSGADIQIVITGLRPGEKLYEELLYDVNNAIKTENQKIFITKIGNYDKNMIEYYEELEKVVIEVDRKKIKEIMKKIVVSYKEVEY